MKSERVRVGACLDTGHAHLAGKLGVAISKLSDHLKMLHANDNRRDLDAHLAPGDGTIDWPFVVRELQRYAFHGPVVLELSAPAHAPPDAVLARAVQTRTSLESAFWEMQQ